ncbi:hypothetical protein H8F11_13425 [Vibrio fluvialis]|uniref:HP1 family phage holin n=1 Tax=Vibrio fluvialis TaxID=676 RepID=UPI00192B8880|nr:HP1 family phage holin [Vibrio fluvialis]EKO3517183.1 hypothetical protein [Vibrio fluvialis]EKO4003679.1 hypothetical protein [Vibrio fluvialis]MBL4266679.1 hypothetical protein [Vibrio fluvialis]MBL4270129.1 hypothetical protein [Vibrio fluvialis]MBY7899942.1 phage holin family protein [Vibrio fluvialis]
MMNQASMDKSVSASSYVASVSTAIGGYLSLSNIALVIGIVTTLILFFMQLKLTIQRTEHYKQKGLQDEEYRRVKEQQDAEYHAARMKALNSSS